MKRCKELSPQLQQRINIWFCVHLGWNFTQVKTALQTCYQQGVFSDGWIYFWMQEFCRGRTVLVDKDCTP